MPLGLLVALVVGGIAGIAVLTHVFGMSRPRRFADEAEASAAFSREYPGTEIRAVHLAADHCAALLETAEGPAIVWAIGADSCARLVTGAQMHDVAQGLSIHLPDITAPRIRVRLDPENRIAWRNLTGVAK